MRPVLWGLSVIAVGSLLLFLLVTSTLATPVPLSLQASCPTSTTFAAGPSPSASAPVAVAVDPVARRVYALHNQSFVVNSLPTNRVSVVNQDTGALITTVPVGDSPKDIAVDSQRNRIFVSNSGDNNVSIIDGSSFSVITTTVGAGPQDVAVDPSAGLVYVANSTGKSLSILNASTGAVSRTVPLGYGAYSVAADTNLHWAYVTIQAFPWTVVAVDGQTGNIVGSADLGLLLSVSGVAVDPGSYVYVSDHDTGTVTKLDFSPTRAISPTAPIKVGSVDIGTYATAVAVDPASHLVYATDNGSDQVTVLDNSLAVQGTPIGTRRFPTAITIDQPDHLAYVADEESDSLSVINTDSRTVVNTIPLGTYDTGLALDSGSGKLYVANYPADAISVVDISSRTVITSWVSGPGPWAVAADPGVSQVYGLNYDDGTMSVLDSATGQLKGPKLAIGSKPLFVTADPNTHMVYATASASGSLTVIDGASDIVTATVTVGNSPVGIAVDDTTGRVYVANQQSGTISVINAATNVVTDTWTMPSGSRDIWGLAIDPALRQLYVTLPPNVIGDFTGLAILNADTGQLITRIVTTDRAERVDVDTNTHQVYMTDSDAGTMTIVDAAHNNAASTVQVGNSPLGVVADPSSGLAYVANAGDGTISAVQPCAPGTPVTPSATATPSPVPTAAGTTTPTPTGRHVVYLPITFNSNVSMSSENIDGR